MSACFSHEKSEAELKERLLALTNHNQHVENCLREQQQQLADARVHISQLEEECRCAKEQLDNEVTVAAWCILNRFILCCN